MDKRSCNTLLSLYSSAAFDTIDHDMRMLNTDFGVSLPRSLKQSKFCSFHLRSLRHVRECQHDCMRTCCCQTRLLQLSTNVEGVALASQCPAHCMTTRSLWALSKHCQAIGRHFFLFILILRHKNNIYNFYNKINDGWEGLKGWLTNEPAGTESAWGSTDKLAWEVDVDGLANRVTSDPNWTTDGWEWRLNWPREGTDTPPGGWWI